MQNLLNFAAAKQAAFEMSLASNGHEHKSTFVQDFVIATIFDLNSGSLWNNEVAPTSLEATKDTFNRASAEWKSDYEMYTELSIAMNWLCWDYYGVWEATKDERFQQISQLYADLYYKTRDYAYSKFTKEQQRYYFEMTD